MWKWKPKYAVWADPHPVVLPPREPWIGDLRPFIVVLYVYYRFVYHDWWCKGKLKKLRQRTPKFKLANTNCPVTNILSKGLKLNQLQRARRPLRKHRSHFVKTGLILHCSVYLPFFLSIFLVMVLALIWFNPSVKLYLCTDNYLDTNLWKFYRMYTTEKGVFKREFLR